MYRKAHRGMSFMDVIVGTALMLIIFTALTGLLRSSIQVSALAKNRSIATTVAESQMEYLRSLSYDSVGTVGGIPSGSVPQTSTTTQNGLVFTVRTFVDYKDDPADGLGSADTNGITTDYKELKVTVSYLLSGTTKSVDLVSNYAPLGLETTTNGGTLKVNVVSATGTALPGASVRIQNTVLSPTVDLTTFSDSDGVVFLPGAPTSTQYQITVTKAEYSSAQTYVRDATNQNPTPGYLTVVKNQTTTATFAIDLLATLNIRTYTPIATSTFSDTFSSGTSIASFSNTALTAGALQLSGSSGSYPPSGSAVSNSIQPTYLAGWLSATATTTVPAGTVAKYHIVDGNGALLPDTALPGNASGFTGTVSLVGVSTTTYPVLALSADLTTSSASSTPQINAWSLSYLRGPIPIATIPFTLTGVKAIGSTGAGAPIYKTTVSTSTNASGLAPLTLEWDSYGLSLPGYDAVEACNAPPYVLSPGTTNNASLILASSTTNMLLVSVSTSAGGLSGATVTLSRTGFTKTVTTTACGSAYFGGITSSSGYTISVSKSGYTTFSASSITLSGHTFYAASLE
ncbi:MAG: Autotransporter adhesin [Parcubacteria group bacterium]|nr:Autotransporter adhesin [Parcubacteria group bacterium]